MCLSNGDLGTISLTTWAPTETYEYNSVSQKTNTSTTSFSLAQ